MSWKRTTTAVAVAAGTALAALVPALPAAAASVDAVTSITIEAPDPANPNAPLTAGERFRVDVAWSLPKTAKAGDTFAVDFPSPVTGFSSSFTLADKTGATVGTCAVTASRFVCTLSDYVSTHVDVTGSLFFYASAEAGASQEQVFTTSAGTKVTVPLPGGEVQPGNGTSPETPPTAIHKDGWQNPDGSLGWVVFVPGSQLMHNGAEVVLTDTYDSRLTLDESSLIVGRIPLADWNGGEWGYAWDPLTAGAGAHTYEFVPGTSSFQLTVHEPDAQSVYAIYYNMTAPAGTPDGTVFENTMSGEGPGSTSAEISFAFAGGGGNGSTVRSLVVTKQVDGDAAAPSGTFPISVDCTADGAKVAGYPATADVAAAASHEFAGIPVGASCTVTETDKRGASAVAYSPSPTVDIPAGDGPVAVTVTNTYTASPTPTPTPTPSPTQSGDPIVPPAPTPSATPSADKLANTGSDTGDAAPLWAGIAALTILAGALIGVTRRRRALR